MNRETNLAHVGALYGAFGSGDIPSMIGMLDPNIEWINPGPTDSEFGDYFGVKHGPDGVLGVFGFLAANVDITAFEPHTFIADDERVVALVKFAATAKATGRTYQQELVQVFEFGDDGKVTRFRDIQNSAVVVEALRG